MPKYLSDQYKLDRMATTLTSLQRYEAEGDDLLSLIVTSDETSAHHESGDDDGTHRMKACHFASKEKA
jgi:hypothetical protein